MNERIKVFLNWYRLRKQHYSTNIELKAIYYIRSKIFWQDLYNGCGRYGCLVEFYNKKLIQNYGIQIGNHCKIGNNFYLPHPIGIIIGDWVNIGNNCIIYQNVTIGVKNNRYGKTTKGMYPILGDGSKVYAGAKVMGPIRIGQNSEIGANAVVLSSTEDNSVYVGIPARRVR